MTKQFKKLSSLDCLEALRPRMIDSKMCWEGLNPVTGEISLLDHSTESLDLEPNKECKSHKGITETLGAKHWWERGWGKSLDAFLPTLIGSDMRFQAFIAKSPVQTAASTDGNFAPRIALRSTESSSCVAKSLLSRRTSRRFRSDAIALEAFSDVLHHAFGPIFSSDDSFSSKARVFEVYLCIFSVSSLAPGIYKYFPVSNEVALVREGDFREEVSAVIQGLRTPYSAGFTLFLAANLENASQVLSSQLALRELYLISGFVCQALVSQAARQDLSVLPTPALNDLLCEKLLGLRPPSETAVYSASIGWTVHDSERP